MATDPEHQREAAMWAKRAADAYLCELAGLANAAATIGQVHATLALVAVERDSLQLNRRIYGSAVAYAALAEPEPAGGETG